LEWLRAEYPAHRLNRSYPILANLRMHKSPAEISQLLQAVKITGAGFKEVLTSIKPGLYEYELEATLSYVFLRKGSKGFAYTPIIAGGSNACIIHYTFNKDVLKDGDLVLLDVGAEYGNYCADLSRTIPVNGRFNPRQKAVYEAVLRVQQFAIAELKPGLQFQDYNSKVGDCVTEELLKLGLLTSDEVKAAPTDKPAYKKFFMHGTSHHLGLDTHDVGNFDHPISAGMVLTVEPGIYIPSERIGVRIENDVVVTENGVRDLMQEAGILTSVEELEAFMTSH
jgi:Xaa-Pro aminopeptidase